MNIERVKFEDKEIILVGTAHISRRSAEFVKKTIEEEKPDIVGVELDIQRFQQLKSGRKWRETDLTKIIREGKTYLFLLNLLLANIQRKLGQKIGVMPGTEMMEAIKIAAEKKIDIQLLDRDVKVTLKRAMNNMSFFEKLKLLYSVIVGMFHQVEISEEKIEELKQEDVMSKLMKELSRQMPSVKKVLVDERDLFIANQILSSPGKKIVAVIGAGHVAGVKKFLDKKRDISKLLVLPSKKNYLKVLKFAIPVLFALLVALGFYFKGIETTVNILIFWFLIHGFLSAFGAVLARAHPYSIITAFFFAPLTSLHPALAAGWFAGYVEARKRSPKVKDFENLISLDSFRDFSENRVTHILMVTAFTNIGSMIGTVIAFPYIISLLG